MGAEGKDLTEAEIEAMSPEARMAWLNGEGDEDDGSPTGQPGVDDTTTGDEGGQGQEEEVDEETDEETGADEGSESGTETEPKTADKSKKEWNPEGPGNKSKAITEERNRRKTAETRAKELESNNSKLEGRVDELTKLVSALMQQGMSAKDAGSAAEQAIVHQESPKEPDFDEDPQAWINFKMSQIEQKQTKLEKDAEEFKKQVTQERYVSTLISQEKAFMADHPEYESVVDTENPDHILTKHYMANKDDYTKDMSSANPIKAAYERGVSLILLDCHQNGTPIPDFLQKGKKPAVETNPDIPPVIKGKARTAPPSLVTVPSKRENPSEDSYGDLSESEYEAISKDPSKREKFLRGK